MRSALPPAPPERSVHPDALPLQPQRSSGSNRLACERCVGSCSIRCSASNIPRSGRGRPIRSKGVSLLGSPGIWSWRCFRSWARRSSNPCCHASTAPLAKRRTSQSARRRWPRPYPRSRGERQSRNRARAQPELVAAISAPVEDQNRSRERTVAQSEGLDPPIVPGRDRTANRRIGIGDCWRPAGSLSTSRRVPATPQPLLVLECRTDTNLAWEAGAVRDVSESDRRSVARAPSHGRWRFASFCDSHQSSRHYRSSALRRTRLPVSINDGRSTAGFFCSVEVHDRSPLVMPAQRDFRPPVRSSCSGPV